MFDDPIVAETRLQRDCYAASFGYDLTKIVADLQARQGKDGRRVVDRRKNVIRRSGENIAAVEVESALQQHPAVAGAGVSAVPDAVRGDEVFACVVLREAIKDDTQRQTLADDIMRHTLARLAYYKAPGYIAFVASLPVTATQKVQRNSLKDLAVSLLDHPQTLDLRALKKRTH